MRLSDNPTGCDTLTTSPGSRVPAVSYTPRENERSDRLSLLSRSTASRYAWLADWMPGRLTEDSRHSTAPESTPGA